MAPKSPTENQWHLSSLIKISTIPPSDRSILWIIANDQSAFSGAFMIEAVKKNLVRPNTPDSNFSKALAIYVSLQQRGYVKSINHAKNKVTIKGQWFRFSTHPSLVAIGVITAIVAICVSVAIAIYTNKPEKQLKQTKRPAADSLPYPKKTDSLRLKLKSINK